MLFEMSYTAAIRIVVWHALVVFSLKNNVLKWDRNLKRPNMDFNFNKFERFSEKFLTSPLLKHKIMIQSNDVCM